MSSIRSYSKLILLAVSCTSLQAQMTVSLSPSASSATLGVPVTWTAAASSPNPGTLVYRFGVLHDRSFHTLVDYGPKSSLTWTTIEEEGPYPMEVSVRNNTTGETASASAMFPFAPITVGSEPVVTPSANPLVYIYSAPACQEGRVRVQFQSAGGIMQSTPSKPCVPGHSMNFYLAGMLPNAPCTAQYIFETEAAVLNGASVTFTPPASTLQPPSVSLLTEGQPPAVDGFLLQSLLSGPCDCHGPKRQHCMDRSQRHLVPDAAADRRNVSGNLRKRRRGSLTSIFSRIRSGRHHDRGDQRGASQRAARASWARMPINAFHHEARKLPNGNYLVLATSERILTNVQGPGPVDVIGDTILVLDPNLQVLWSWDSFDHLDTTRQAILGETCAAGNAGCAPWYLAPVANDWLHGNALQLTPGREYPVFHS